MGLFSLCHQFKPLQKSPWPYFKEERATEDGQRAQTGRSFLAPLREKK